MRKLLLAILAVALVVIVAGGQHEGRSHESQGDP